MSWCYITFRSITPAQRGEAALRRAGFAVQLRRTPKWMAEKGCGYCLLLRPEDGTQGAQTLRRLGLRYQKRYLVDETGHGEELPE